MKILDMSFREQREVAANIATPPGALAELGKSADWWVVYLVAQNPQTPPSTLRKIAEEWDLKPVIWALRENPNTPENVKALLSGAG